MTRGVEDDRILRMALDEGPEFVSNYRIDHVKFGELFEASVTFGPEGTKASKFSTISWQPDSEWSQEDMEVTMVKSALKQLAVAILMRSPEDSLSRVEDLVTGMDERMLSKISSKVPRGILTRTTPEVQGAVRDQLVKEMARLGRIAAKSGIDADEVSRMFLDADRARAVGAVMES
jgi:hypothetical protein